MTTVCSGQSKSGVDAHAAVFKSLVRNPEQCRQGTHNVGDVPSDAGATAVVP